MYLPGAFAEFSSKWRTRFSHLRGGSENSTVVLEFSRDDDRDTARGRSVASLGTLMPTRCTGLCTQLGIPRQLKWETDRTRCRSIGYWLQVRFGALSPTRMSHERCVAILRRLLLRRTFETQRPGRSYPVGVGLRRLECGLFRDPSCSLRSDRRHGIASAHAICPSKPSDVAMAR
jgi:hypothetical protein